MLKLIGAVCRCGVFLALAVLSGCASPKMAWVYIAESPQDSDPIVDGSLVVPPFEDQRDTTNRDRSALAMLPLVPFADSDFGSPDTAGQFRFTPKDDLARAMAEEISNARLFRESVFDSRPQASDYVLRGKIIETRLKLRLFFYGLSLPGDLFWLLGLPAGATWNELRVELELQRPTDRAVIWSHRVSEKKRDVAWLYEGQLQPFYFEELWKKAIASAMPSLRESLTVNAP